MSNLEPNMTLIERWLSYYQHDLINDLIRDEEKGIVEKIKAKLLAVNLYSDGIYNGWCNENAWYDYCTVCLDEAFQYDFENALEEYIREMLFAELSEHSEAFRNALILRSSGLYHSMVVISHNYPRTENFEDYMDPFFASDELLDSLHEEACNYKMPFDMDTIRRCVINNRKNGKPTRFSGETDNTLKLWYDVEDEDDTIVYERMSSGLVAKYRKSQEEFIHKVFEKYKDNTLDDPGLMAFCNKLFVRK